MADELAWKDRQRIIDSFKGLQQSLNDFKLKFEALDKLRTAALSNQNRLDEMIALLSQDPNWDIASLQAKYNELKAIYDYLEAL